jgi:hypothetical protein
MGPTSPTAAVITTASLGVRFQAVVPEHGKPESAIGLTDA